MISSLLQDCNRLMDCYVDQHASLPFSLIVGKTSYLFMKDILLKLAQCVITVEGDLSVMKHVS